MLGLTIVGLIVSILFLYWRVIHLTARLEDTRTLAADALDAHTTALTRFSERLGAMEYPRYMGTPIGADRPVESPETSDMAWEQDLMVSPEAEREFYAHHQRPRKADACDQSEIGEWGAHDHAVAEALKTPLPNPNNSPFFSTEK